MQRSKTGGWLVIFGSLFVLGLFERKDSKIGKLEDYRPRDGGRIDKYWLDSLNIELQPKKTVGRHPHYQEDYMFEPKSFVDHFKLSGVEFGNWMNQNDRFNALWATAVSFRDLARILGVPHKNIGKSKLSIAFGARGSGPALAHYERNTLYTINLTKHGGQGSLAHEYGHFIDNLLGLKAKSQTMLSGGRSIRSQRDHSVLSGKKGLKYHMEAVFDILYWKDNGKPTRFLQENKQRSEYYTRRTEVWARTIEAYVFLLLSEKKILNRWLVPSRPDDSWPPLHLVKKAQKHIKFLIKEVLR